MIIGYIPLNADGTVNKQGTRRFKIYMSFAMAAQFSPVDKAVPVYVEETE